MADPDEPRVVVTFRAGWLLLSPPAGDHGAIDYDAYDVSRLFRSSIAAEDFDKAFDSFWIREQRSPEPGLYEVESSAWVRQTGAGKYRQQHYILGAHDAQVEVLASGWSWEYMREARPYYNDPDYGPGDEP